MCARHLTYTIFCDVVDRHFAYGMLHWLEPFRIEFVHICGTDSTDEAMSRGNFESFIMSFWLPVWLLLTQTLNGEYVLKKRSVASSWAKKRGPLRGARQATGDFAAGKHATLQSSPTGELFLEADARLVKEIAARRYSL